MINIDDAKKVEIKIGKILSADSIPKSEKLLKLSVDFGEEAPRQILSGIAVHYANPEELVGVQAAFITNLEPREMMGLQSQGMILAVSGEFGFSLLHPKGDVPPGSTIR